MQIFRCRLWRATQHKAYQIAEPIRGFHGDTVTAGLCRNWNGDHQGLVDAWMASRVSLGASDPDRPRDWDVGNGLLTEMHRIARRKSKSDDSNACPHRARRGFDRVDGRCRWWSRRLCSSERGKPTHGHGYEHSGERWHDVTSGAYRSLLLELLNFKDRCAGLHAAGFNPH